MSKIVLSVKNLSLKSKKTHDIIVDNVSFEINQGEAVILSGENGSGKSSILKCIMRDRDFMKDVDVLEESQIIYEDNNILQMNDSQLTNFRSNTAYVPQKDDYASFKSFTVEDAINFFGNPKEKISSAEIQKLLNEYSPNNKVNIKINSDPSKLSGGQQRVLSLLAKFIAKSSNFFIIDEPLNNLDSMMAKIISDAINKRLRKNSEATLIMVTHCRIFPFITRTISINKGKITQNNSPYNRYDCLGDVNSENNYL